MRPVAGESYREDGSAAFGIRGTNRTTVLIHDPLHNRQTEAGATTTACKERLEDPRHVHRRKALALVAHGAFDLAVGHYRAHGHSLPLDGVLHGVEGQGLEGLRKARSDH